VPFVQGQISGERASAVIETECGHCHQPLHVEIDSELEFRVVEEGAEPLVYVPLLDVRSLDEPSIIDSF
jgi:hypothetical protein